ncbi:MAG: histidine kinase dimerization/phospho-acceptor domain-containing protein, partial [Halanaerobium sp.]
MRLRNKILIVFTIIIILLAVVISLFFNQLFDFFLQEQDDSTLEIINSQVLEQFENKKRELLRKTESIAEYELFRKNLTVISSEILNPLAAEKQIAYNQLDFFLNFFSDILDLDFFAVMNENDDFLYGKNELTRSVMPEEGLKEEVSLQISNNDLYIVSNKKINIQSRRFRLISGFKIDQEFLDLLIPDQNLPIFIFTETNYLLKNNDFELPLTSFFSEDSYWEKGDQIYSAQKRNLYTGSKQIFYLGILHDKGLYYQLQRRFQNFLWLVFAFTIIISLLIFNFISRSISRPVDKLIESIKNVAAGNYQHKLKLKTSVAEIEEVKEEYNKMLDKLDSSRKYINKLINNLPVGILAYDQKGEISYFNNTFLELFNLKAESLLAENIEKWSYAYKFKQNEEKISWELKIDGSSLEIDSFSFENEDTSENLHVIRDMSQKKKYQDYLLKTERQAAIGKVTAALAHEINNPLGIISNYLELIINQSQEENLEYAELIKKELRRITRLMKEMMQVARGKTELKIREVNLKKWLQGWEDLISWQAAKKNINLKINKSFDKNQL